MHRFYLPPEQCQDASATLGGREAYHAVHVLRLARGARVVVLDGVGQELDCEVTEASREFVRLEVRQRRRAPPWPCRITLVQAIPKGRIIEDIIEKATELGIFRIVPLVSERVVTRLTTEEAEAKAAKWQRTALEAIKQSGNPWLPVVDTPMSPKAFLARKEPCELALIGSLAEKGAHPREAFRRFVERRGRLPETLQLWVGPEGDFTPAEVELAKAAGAVPITLGRLVLRCETAALYGLSVIHHELTTPYSSS